jgi:hypothetical protein
MKKFNLDHLPNYKKLIETQPFVENSDFEPIILKNILTQQQINKIVDLMDNTPKQDVRVQDWGGQGCFDNIILDKEITEKVQWAIENATGQKLTLGHYSVVRYSNEYGYLVKLFPHYDTRYAEMFVLDLQLKTSEDWGIIVEGEQFNLKDGESLIFSGTQQMHWREKKELMSNAEINMIFFWFTHKVPKLTPLEHDKIMRLRENVLMNETFINSEVVKTKNE